MLDKRLVIFRKAAEIMRRELFEISAAITIDNGKNRYEAVGGVAANVASGLGRLGQRVACYSKAGQARPQQNQPKSAPTCQHCARRWARRRAAAWRWRARAWRPTTSTSSSGEPSPLPTSARPAV